MNRRAPRGYPLLVAGHIVSTFGSSIYLIGLVVYLADVRDSAAVVGAIQFAAYLPAALFGPIAGALVDRWDRKRVVVWTDLARGLVMLAAAGSALIWGAIPIVVIFFVTVAVSMSGVLFLPAVHSLVPDLVGPDRLKLANGARAAATQAANLIGSAVGAILYAVLGAPMLFALNGVSFLLSGLAEIPIVPIRQSRAQKEPLGTSISDGFRLLRSHAGVRSLVIVQATANLLLPPIVVSLPFVLRDTWQIPDAYFGLYFATVLAGGVTAFGIVSLRSTGRRFESVAYAASLPVIAGFMGALTLLCLPGIVESAAIRVLLFPLFFVLGAAVGSIHVIGVTRIQQSVDPQSRGRVFATSESITAALLPLVYLISGVAVQTLRDTPWVVYAAMALLASAVAVIAVRSSALASALQDEHPTAATR